MSPEELETHNQVKAEITSVLCTLVKQQDSGKFYTDGALLTNAQAGLSTEPDGTFVSWESLESNRVRLTSRKGSAGQFIEMVGCPDMVLEVVSTSSIEKDNHLLKQAYHRAGVREYWLVDARAEEMVFRILCHQPSGYAAAPLRRGWVHSGVLDRSFRLERRRGRMNLWRYTATGFAS